MVTLPDAQHDQMDRERREATRSTQVAAALLSQQNLCSNTNDDAETNLVRNTTTPLSFSLGTHPAQPQRQMQRKPRQQMRQSTVSGQQATTTAGDVKNPTQFVNNMNTALVLVQLNSEMAEMAAMAALVVQLNLGSSTNDAETNLAEDTTTVEDIHSAVGTLTHADGTLTRAQRIALNQQRRGKNTSKKKAQQNTTRRKTADAARKTTRRKAASHSQQQTSKASAAHRMAATRRAKSDSQKQADKDADAGHTAVKRAARTVEQVQSDKDSAALRKAAMRAARTNEQVQAEKDADVARKRATTASGEAKKEKHRVDFSTTELTAESHFDHFEQHPETSAMLFHINSGHLKFRDLEKIHRQDALKKRLVGYFISLPEDEQAPYRQKWTKDEETIARGQFEEMLRFLVAQPRSLLQQFEAALAAGSSAEAAWDIMDQNTTTK